MCGYICKKLRLIVQRILHLYVEQYLKWIIFIKIYKTVHNGLMKINPIFYMLSCG